MYTRSNVIWRIFVPIVCLTQLAAVQPSRAAGRTEQSLPGCWPQEYKVQQDDTSGVLTLSTRYYTVQQDLKRGGAITKIKYIPRMTML